MMDKKYYRILYIERGEHFEFVMLFEGNQTSLSNTSRVMKKFFNVDSYMVSAHMYRISDTLVGAKGLYNFIRHKTLGNTYNYNLNIELLEKDPQFPHKKK